MILQSLKKNYHYIWLTFIIAFILYDHYQWSKVLPWNVDESSNLWLGIKIPLNQLVTGFKSSQGFPHPNGVPLFGKLFSAFSSPRTVGCITGLIFALLAGLWCYVISKKKINSLTFWSSFLLLQSFVTTRAQAGDFSNLSLHLIPNLIFIILVANYLLSKNIYTLIGMIMIMPIPPAIYIAGPPMSFSMLATFVLLIYILPPRNLNKKNIFFCASILILYFAISFYFIWLPYLSVIDPSAIRNQPRPSFLLGQGYRFLEQIVLFPYTMIFEAYTSPFGPIRLGDMKINTPIVQTSGKVLVYLFQFQALIFSTALISTIVFYKKQIFYFRSLQKIKDSFINLEFKNQHLILLILYTTFNGGFTPALGGIRWSSGWRPELLSSYYPLFLFILFFTPCFFNYSDRLKNVLTKITYINFCIFISGQLITGLFVCKNHLDYNGDTRTDSEVPVVYKEQVIDFIVNDWKKYSTSNVIPIEYDLSKGWEWINKHGEGLAPSLKNPYQVGRGFDLILWMKYKMMNLEEGIQHRSHGKAQYVVNYRTDEAPIRDGRDVEYFYFNRYRLSRFH